MENTENLSLPYILPSQAQKHVTHNEALVTLDTIVQLAVLDRDLSAPPASPAESARYIVGPSATGAWSGKSGMISAWQDGGWNFYTPKIGWLCFIVDENALAAWNGAQWLEVSTLLAALQNLSLLGLGTSADAANPFSAKLNKALWTAKTTGEGGTGDLRYTLNKQASANVLSLLMQSNWSGRAELGLIGNDNLSLKVSADGSNWLEAFNVNGQTGKIAFPRTNVPTDTAINLLPDSGRFAGNTLKTETAATYTFPTYITLSNSATQVTATKFITNNTDYGGAGGALDAQIRALVDMIRISTNRRYGTEFFAARITAGAGTATPVTVNSVNYYLSAALTPGPRLPAMTFHCYLRALDATIVYGWAAGQTIYKNGVAYTDNVPITAADGWVSITVTDEQDPRASTGYGPSPLNVYAAASGHRYLLACPALMAGLTKIDDNIGSIPAINRWLP